MVTWRVDHADCIDAMREMDEASVDAIVCDPPYSLGFMSKAWDMQVQHEGWTREALRVLKPGGHLLAAGGTRTFHRLVSAIEDAGFEVRDCIAHMYGSGFPKSHNLKGDRQGFGTALKPGFEPWTLARKPLIGTVAANVQEHGTGALNINASRVNGAGNKTFDRRPGKRSREQYRTGTTDAGRPTDMGRWPANVVLSHTEDCRVVGNRRVKNPGGVPDAHSEKASRPAFTSRDETSTVHHFDEDGTETVEKWECAEGCPVRALDEQSGERRSAGEYTKGARGGANDFQGPASIPINGLTAAQYGDTGGASRFFYTAKASRAERNAGLEGFEGSTARNYSGGPLNHPEHESSDGARRTGERHLRQNSHPTVKPLALMRWLCRLVTPPDGLILDPFAGSGTTGCAAILEGFDFIGIEREAEYVEIARARIAHWEKQTTQLALAESA